MTIRDKDIREPLFDFLEAEYGKIRIIEEKTMDRSRADVVMVTEKLPKYSGKNKRYVAKVIADKIPEEKLDRMISEELFERDYTVFDDET